MGNRPARSDCLLMTQNTSVQHQRMFLFPSGKMFQAPDLNLIVEFIFMFYKEKPIDWLLDHILWVKVCNPEKDAVRTLSTVLKSITVGYKSFSSYLFVYRNTASGRNPACVYDSGPPCFNT